jgi:RNA polymerase sigma-70 factor (ECF subfamily)
VVSDDVRTRQDAALAERIRDGDEKAFAELFRAYHPRLCAFITARVHSPDVAEDLAMDVFRRLWHGREEWSVHTSVRAYLFRAATHAVTSHVRREITETRFTRDLHAMEDDSPTRAPRRDAPDSRVMNNELGDAIASAIDELPERGRAVFLLWQQALSYSDIAQALDISTRTVETHLARALRTLRARLLTYGS